MAPTAWLNSWKAYRRGHDPSPEIDHCRRFPLFGVCSLLLVSTVSIVRLSRSCPTTVGGSY